MPAGQGIRQSIFPLSSEWINRYGYNIIKHMVVSTDYHKLEADALSALRFCYLNPHSKALLAMHAVDHELLQSGYDDPTFRWEEAERIMVEYLVDRRITDPHAFFWRKYEQLSGDDATRRAKIANAVLGCVDISDCGPLSAQDTSVEPFAAERLAVA
jgi:hypothetical protein